LIKDKEHPLGPNNAKTVADFTALDSVRAMSSQKLTNGIDLFGIMQRPESTFLRWSPSIRSTTGSAATQQQYTEPTEAPAGRR